MPNLFVIFTTGLLTGGVTCMAVQGGLLATAVVQSKANKILAVTGFLAAKLAAYTILGLGLGWMGSFLVLSPTALGIMQAAVAIYMLGVAGALLNIHPIFRYFIIQTPSFITRRIRKESKSGQLLAPVILGLATILIPCGTTQAMMALAISSAHPLAGAGIMAAFILGTGPVFMILGWGVAKVGDIFKGSFGKIAAAAVVLVAIVNLNGALVVLNSPIHLAKIGRLVYCTISFCPSGAVAGVQIPASLVNIKIRSNGYVVDNPVIKAGERITLKLSNEDGSGCQQAFTIPALGVSRIVRMGQSDEISFIAPKQPGKLAYSCSMGMYSGELTVVN